VHCGFCLNVCPTYTRLGNEADSPRGRLYLMRAVAEGRLPAEDDAFARHIDQCLGCRACETVCPSGVEYGFLLERTRAVIADRRGVDPLAKALLWSFGAKLPMRVASAGGRLLRAGGFAGWLARVLPRAFGTARMGLAMLGATRPWPALRRGSDGSAGAPVPGGAGRSAGQVRPRVGLLTGCVQQGLFARVNRATADVLRANGCEVVEVPGQACCGALHAHSGELTRAHELAQGNIAAFEAAGVDYVIVNAAGCGAMMKEYGKHHERDDAWRERAAAFSLRVRDLFEFLVERGVRTGAPLPLRVTYDAPCHLHHAQRITRAPLDVLATIPALELVPLEDADECCGGAGVYGIQHPELGGRIVDDKLNAIADTGAQVVVTPNPGCIMQIGAGLLLRGDARPVLHPVELLAESYRRAGL
jgi:glycolate oxidase iron-sulfur subunit